MVKPAPQGSALGVRFAASRDDVPEALVAAFSYDDRVLLERHVAGRELAVSLLDGEPLPVVEVRPKEEDRFNYEARYEIGRTEYVCPADLATAETAEVQGVAARAYEALGCTGFARVDLMLDADSTPQVLEANAIPGLTDTSLLPMAADAAGTQLRGARRRESSSWRWPGGTGDEAGSCRALLLALGEVLGRHLVEEVLELLDHFLGVLDLVLELDRRLVDDVVGGEDRRLRSAPPARSRPRAGSRSRARSRSSRS